MRMGKKKAEKGKTGKGKGKDLKAAQQEKKTEGPNIPST